MLNVYDTFQSDFRFGMFFFLPVEFLWISPWFFSLDFSTSSFRRMKRWKRLGFLCVEFRTFRSLILPIPPYDTALIYALSLCYWVLSNPLQPWKISSAWTHSHLKRVNQIRCAIRAERKCKRERWGCQLRWKHPRWINKDKIG